MCRRNLCLSVFLILVWGRDAAVWSPQCFIMELIISFACVVPLCFCSWLSCARSECKLVFSLPCSAFKTYTVLEAENKGLSHIHLCLSGYALLGSHQYLFFRIMCVWIWQGEWVYERQREPTGNWNQLSPPPCVSTVDTAGIPMHIYKPLTSGSSSQPHFSKASLS